MDYRDDEYLKLFKQIKEDQPMMVETRRDYTFEQLRGNASSYNEQMLKETPNYNIFNQPNINEVQRNNYSQDLNLNEFNIETRINGQNINEVKRQDKEDKLFEVMQKLREDRLNEVKQTQERESLNEVVNFQNADVITLEMFERARYNSMMMVANRILPK